MIGPFMQSPVRNLQISSLGVVSKKAPGECRLIHYLSYPEGKSINDWILVKFCSVKYASLDQTIRMVRRCGTGALMAKTDIQSA